VPRDELRNRGDPVQSRFHHQLEEERATTHTDHHCARVYTSSWKNRAPHPAHGSSTPSSSGCYASASSGQEPEGKSVWMQNQSSLSYEGVAIHPWSTASRSESRTYAAPTTSSSSTSGYRATSTGPRTSSQDLQTEMITPAAWRQSPGWGYSFLRDNGERYICSAFQSRFGQVGTSRINTLHNLIPSQGINYAFPPACRAHPIGHTPPDGLSSANNPHRPRMGTEQVMGTAMPGSCPHWSSHHPLSCFDSA
jgi:hypothetical protein